MESKKVPDVMWFEFVFDKTGKFLTTHLSTPNAGKAGYVWEDDQDMFRRV